MPLAGNVGGAPRAEQSVASVTFNPSSFPRVFSGNPYSAKE